MYYPIIAVKKYDEEFLRETSIVGGFYPHHPPDLPYWRRTALRNWMMHYPIKGYAVFRFGARQIECHPGTAVLIAPDTPHDYFVPPEARRWDVYWSVFDPPANWAHLMRWPEVGSGHFAVEIDDERIRSRVEEKLNEMVTLLSNTLVEYAPTATHDSLAMNALEGMLLWCHAQLLRRSDVILDPRVRAAAEYLGANLSRKTSLSETADHAGLSVPQLTRLFRSQLGCSVNEFLERQRMTRARQLLRFSALNIAEIAGAVGFESAFYFTRRFSRWIGCSPTEFRKRISRDGGEKKN